MAVISTFTPDQNVVINTSTGIPFSQVFDYFYSDDVSGYAQDIAIVTAPGSSTVLPAGSTVFPGVIINAGTYPAPVGPLNGVTISGTPTIAGTFYVYVRSRYVTNTVTYDNFVVYTVVVGGNALELTPDNSSEITTGLSQNNYLSSQFSIVNGSGSYKVVAQGLPPGVGLSRTAVVQPTPTNALSLTGDNFYLTGIPSLAGVYSNIQFTIKDSVSGQTLVTPLYTLTISNASSGTLTLSKSSQNPITLLQEEAAQVVYNATGGSGSYAWNLTGSLPAGLVFTQVGNQTVITGTPTGYGTFTGASLTATSGGTVSGSLALTFQITPNVVLRGSLPTTAETGVAYSGSLTIAGGDGSSTYNFETTGVIPSWMSITQVGDTLSFTGTPLISETVSFSVRASSTLTSGGTIYSALSAVSVVVSGNSTTPAMVVSFNGTPLQYNTSTGKFTLSYNQYSQINTAWTLEIDFSALSFGVVNAQLDAMGQNFYNLSPHGNAIDLTSVSFPFYNEKSRTDGLAFTIQSYSNVTKKIILKGTKDDLTTKVYSHPSPGTDGYQKYFRVRLADAPSFNYEEIVIGLNITPEILYNTTSTGVSSYNDVTKTITLQNASVNQAYGPYNILFDLPDVGATNGEGGSAWDQNAVSYDVASLPAGLTAAKVSLSGENYRPKLQISGTPTVAGTFSCPLTVVQRQPPGTSGPIILTKNFNIALTVTSTGGGNNSAITLLTSAFNTASGHPVYDSNTIDFKTTAGGTYYIKAQVKHNADDNALNSSYFVDPQGSYVPSIGAEVVESGLYYHIYGPFTQGTFYKCGIVAAEYVSIGFSYPFTIPYQLSVSSDTSTFGTSKQFTVKHYNEPGPTNIVSIPFNSISYQAFVDGLTYIFEGQTFSVTGITADSSWVSAYSPLNQPVGDWKLSKAPGQGTVLKGNITPVNGTTATYSLPVSTVADVPGNCCIEYNAYETNYMDASPVTAGYAGSWFLTLPRSSASFNLTCEEGTCTFDANAIGDTYTLVPTGGSQSDTYVYSTYYNISTDYPWLTVKNVNGNCVLEVTAAITANVSKDIIIKAVRNGNAITSKVVKVNGTITGGGGSTTTLTSISPNTYVINGAERTGVTVTGTNLGDVDFIRIRNKGTNIFQNYTPTSNTGTVITITLNAGGTPWGGNSGICDVEAITSLGEVLATLYDGFTWSNAPVLSITGVNPSFITASASPIDRTVQVSGNGFSSSCQILYDPKGVIGDRITLATTNSGGVLTGVIPASYLGLDDIYATNTINVRDTATNTTTATSANIEVRPPDLEIDTTSLASATIGVAYSETLSATGGTEPYVNWTVVPSLPDGLSLNSSTGEITGTPLATAVTKNLTFSVQDSGTPVKNATKALTLAVTGGASVAITTAALPQATIGQGYNVIFQATGGVLPYSWSITSGSIPAGLNFSSSGQLAGTPASNNSPGNYTFTVRVQDSTGGTPLYASTTFTLILNAAQSVLSITDFTPKTGPVDGGTPVTITGAGFLANAVVYFGNNVARSIQILNNGTTITCISPAASSQINPLDLTVFIKVVNTDGGQISSAATYEYTVQSVPNVVSIDKQDGPFAGGQAIILYGTNFTSDVAVKFGLDFNSSFSGTVTSVDLQSNPQRIYVTTPTWSLPHDNVGRVDVNIYVQNSSGIGTLPSGDTGYTYRAAPVITGIIPAAGPSSGGNTVYVLGRYFFSRGAAKPRVFVGSVEIPPENIILVEE